MKMMNAKTLGFIHFAFTKLSKKRQDLLVKRNKQVVALIVDILYNIANNNIVPRDTSTINNLKKERRHIYKLFERSTSHNKKSKILIQRSNIIKAILPLLPSIRKTIQNEPLYEDVSYKRRR